MPERLGQEVDHARVGERLQRLGGPAPHGRVTELQALGDDFERILRTVDIEQQVGGGARHGGAAAAHGGVNEGRRHVVGR